MLIGLIRCNGVLLFFMGFSVDLVIVLALNSCFFIGFFACFFAFFSVFLVKSRILFCFLLVFWNFCIKFKSSGL